MNIDEIITLAEKGDADAQFRLALYYESDCPERDFGKAVYWYTKSAEQGNAHALNNLGICYYNGQGVAENAEEAKKLWLKAKELGNQTAAENLRIHFKIN
ncbi:MAG: sel1 repeat family protein [Clostridia bacterium]|nr:sel1 repeat family protein [Clostridia bacterium]